MHVIVFLGLTILCSVIRLIGLRKEWSLQKAVEIVLFYFLVIHVGLCSLFVFWGHAFLADKVAASIGWAAGSPFQFEVAMANLALGVLGVLCIFFKENFWLATGIGYAVFLFGAAFGHIREIVTAGNYALNNAGPILYIGDIAIPVLILVLLAVKRFTASNSPASE
jgi:hypothetical protein